MVEHDSDFGSRHPLPRVMVSFDGDLDLSRIDELDRALGPASSLYGVELTVDVTGVTFIDATVLGWLLCIQEKLGHRKGRLRVVATPDGGLIRILALTGLQDQIKVDLLRASASGPQLSATISI